MTKSELIEILSRKQPQLAYKDIELETLWEMVDVFEQENFVGGRL